MRWTLIDKKTFRLQKDAEKWVKEKKKQYKQVEKVRTEVNFLSELNQWEGVVYIGVENG